jgi:hypothetical protein
MWKEEVVAYFKIYPGICLEELRKTKITIRMDICCSGRTGNLWTTTQKRYGMGLFAQFPVFKCSFTVWVFSTNIF